MKGPDFLVIGAAKCGTTTLHHWLRQHPQVFVPATKEPRHFALAGRVPALVGRGDMEAMGEAVVEPAAYEALFAERGAALAAGEVSPLYLFEPGTAERIHAAEPGMRIIAVLRDPAERAFSSWLHLVRLGREDVTPFSRALDAEEERAGEPRALLWHYRAAGFYDRLLAPYFRLFPRERIHVLLAEDLASDPHDAMKRIFEFLGVDASFVPETGERHNVGSVARRNGLHAFLHGDHPVKSVLRRVIPGPVRRRLVDTAAALNRHRPQLDGPTRGRLVEAFRPDILALERRIDRDLSAWLRP